MNEESCGTDEQPIVIAVPEVLGIAIVAVEPEVVVVVLNVEHVEVAVRVSYV